MKLIMRVRPGVELTCAIFWPSRELIRLDLPTLERPRKANSGGPSGGKNLGSAAEVRNLAMMFFIKVTTSVAKRSKSAKCSPQIYANKCRSKKLITEAQRRGETAKAKKQHL